ncbi:GWxTD domain-containing protein [Rhodohalobacter sp. 8-1]|uniref:GWxTD domain-containing protein n=1 Tax=Rhodohalobacter sp. 8-1 TaxID=3131972 RepID=UPI0030EE268A
MLLFRYSFLVGFVVACWLSGAVMLQAQQPSAYQQGLEQLYRGNVDEALAYWETNYTEQSRVDARIGFEYLRIVTEQNFTERFEEATEMYYRALLKGAGANSRIAVRQEIERLKPIVGDGIFRQWTEWWDDEKDKLGSDIRGYWIQLDPTPAHVVNERLIEHWQRIAEARDRFTKNSSTIYGTDERALIFVRYGEPDRVQSGLLTLQDMNIKPWLEQQIIRRQPRNPDEADNLEYDDVRLPQLREQALEFILYENHRYPEYEIWFYDDITVNSESSVPFIFGTNIRNDQFEKLRTIEEFIPERAYSSQPFEERDMLQFTRSGITPALMLQMLYYEQLSSIDPFFEQRLNSLRDRVLEQEREVYSGLDTEFRKESAELIQQQVLHAPRQLSTIESKIPSVPINVYQYRLLDESQTPILVTFVESDPREAFMIDFTRNRIDTVSLTMIQQAEDISNTLPQYQLQHSLQTYNANWELTGRKTAEPGFTIQRNPFRAGASTVFWSEHTHRAQRSASAELKNTDESTQAPAFDTPYPEAIRGLGSVHYREPEPLSTNPDSLQVADLVLGYGIDTNEMSEEKMFPFFVANSQTIPWQETLALHFEVYNLRVQPNGFSRFELTYQILPVDESGKVLTDQTEFVLTLNFTSEENRLVENLEIETADLMPGLYELRVQITDVNSDQQVDRHTRFEVLD